MVVCAFLLARAGAGPGLGAIGENSEVLADLNAKFERVSSRLETLTVRRRKFDFVVYGYLSVPGR